jgi:hypothetical protein
MKFTGPFAPGALMRGLIVPTKVNEDVAKAQQEYPGMPVEIAIGKDGAGAVVFVSVASVCN